MTTATYRLTDLPADVMVLVQDTMGEMQAIDDYGHDSHVKIEVLPMGARTSQAFYVSRWATITHHEGFYAISDPDWASYAD